MLTLEEGTTVVAKYAGCQGYYETLVPTVWHDPASGWFNVPAGERCQWLHDPSDIPNAIEQQAFRAMIRRERRAGKQPVIVLLKNRLRVLDRKTLRPVK
jgi:hypothetical protein